MSTRVMTHGWQGALGCLLGAFTGDAAGATLEFRPRVSEADARWAMSMPGGGQLNVGPGQITDDSELALALAHALLHADVDASDADEFPAQHVSQAYNEWFQSHPFDCGMTCARAMQGNYPTAEQMMRQAHDHSMASEANGALMRCMPLAIWGCRMPAEALARAAAADARLTHPSPVTVACNQAYVVALAHLITHPGDAAGAIAAAHAALQPENAKVRGWLTEAVQSGGPAAATRHVGHVRWAFTLAFFHLAKGSSFEEGVFDTLLCGGDTDTNACIVGGMLGALHGADAIPQAMTAPVLGYAHRPDSLLGHARPERYRASRCAHVARDLLLRACRR
jgi:ADP-ribosyl-[dinitrogen reductase] hydrolase